MHRWREYLHFFINLVPAVVTAILNCNDDEADMRLETVCRFLPILRSNNDAIFKFGKSIKRKRSES